MCFVFNRGGYIVVPKSVEFWQGQSDRLHDRIKFRRPKPGEKPDNILVHQGDDGWVYERLSPWLLNKHLFRKNILKVQIFCIYYVEEFALVEERAIVKKHFFPA